MALSIVVRMGMPSALIMTTPKTPVERAVSSAGEGDPGLSEAHYQRRCSSVESAGRTPLCDVIRRIVSSTSLVPCATRQKTRISQRAGWHRRTLAASTHRHDELSPLGTALARLQRAATSKKNAPTRIETFQTRPSANRAPPPLSCAEGAV